MKIIVLATALIAAGHAYAADHRVEMLNKGKDGAAMVFEPHLVLAQPGDTVTFVPIDKGHNSSSVKGGIPAGATDWKGKMNEELSVTVSAEGVYVFDCTPHFGMGMVGAILVGKPVNLAEVKALKYPGKAKAASDTIFAEIEKGM